MKITVKNFGPIREAKDIEISPMTLFVGPSNTGKSYLAVLIYSIFNVLNGKIPQQQFQQQKATPQEKKRYEDNVKKLSNAVSKKSSATETQKIAEDLAESIFFGWASHIRNSLKSQIVYCFGEEGNKLLKDKDVSIILSPSNSEISVNLISPSESKISPKIKKMLGSRLVQATERPRQGFFRDDAPYHRILQSGSLSNDRHADLFVSLLWKNSNVHSCHYLPATRGGIMQSHRALVGTLIEQAAMAGLTEIRPTPMFTGVLATFMQKLIHIGERKKEERGVRVHFPFSNIDTFPLIFYSDLYRSKDEKYRRKIVSIGKSMETKIMQGEIEVKKTETNYPNFHYKFRHNNKPHNLSLMNTSSMVSELAPVSLFIRHYLGKRDMFIVEEPEAHLHPEGQRAIADVLVQLANAGVFVLATTHSDIILEQISNSVHAPKSTPTKLKGFGSPLTSLNKDTSASYTFVKGKKNTTTVRKIRFDSTTGLITKDHLRASSDLYNQTVGLLERQDDEE